MEELLFPMWGTLALLGGAGLFVGELQYGGLSVIAGFNHPACTEPDTRSLALTCSPQRTPQFRQVRAATLACRHCLQAWIAERMVVK